MEWRERVQRSQRRLDAMEEEILVVREMLRGAEGEMREGEGRVWVRSIDPEEVMRRSKEVILAVHELYQWHRKHEVL